MHYLIYLNLFCVVGLFSLEYSVNANTPKSVKVGDKNVCIEESCVIAAGALLESIDFSVDPCNDFYRFACGGYIQKRLPDLYNMRLIMPLFETEKSREHEIANLFEVPPKEDEPVYFRNLRNIYESCMNLTAIEEVGSQPLQDLLEELGGWPVVKGDDWDEESYNWVDMNNNLMKRNFPDALFYGFLALGSSKGIHLMLLGPSFHVPGLVLLHSDNETEMSYLDYLVDAAVTLGADRERAKVEMLELMDFVIELTNITNDNGMPFSGTILDMVNMTQEIDWIGILNDMYRGKVTEDTPVTGPPNTDAFLQNGVELIKNTPKRVIANYQLWRVIQYSSRWLGKDFSKLDDYKHIVEEITYEELKERRAFCSGYISQELPLSVLALYSRVYFNVHYVEDIQRLVSSILQEFNRTIAISWLEENAKTEIQAWLDDMELLVGFPPDVFNDTMMESYFNALDTNETSFFWNNLKMKEFTYEQFIADVNEPTAFTRWNSVLAFSSARLTRQFAFYAQEYNLIGFSPAWFRGTYYNVNLPNYMKYGAIGLILGHEIAHSVTTILLSMSKREDMANTSSEYVERRQCLIDNFKNYHIHEISEKADGERTVTEDEADITGFRIARKVYDDWLQNNPEEDGLPGLDFTSKQLFWISSAAFFCRVDELDNIRTSVQFDDHSLNRFRIFNPLSNLDEFSEDFNCPLGSPMNRKNKCVLWD